MRQYEFHGRVYTRLTKAQARQLFGKIKIFYSPRQRFRPMVLRRAGIMKAITFDNCYEYAKSHTKGDVMMVCECQHEKDLL